MHPTHTATAIDPDFTARNCPRCEYSLIGLPPTTRCPECGLDPVQFALHAAAPPGARYRHVARCHLIGLILLLVAVAWGLEVVLIENTSRSAGGNLPLINVPGPKLWAVGTLRRTTGNYVSSYGVQGMHAMLLSVAAMWLLTVPQLREKGTWLRSGLRYGSVVAGGVAFGLAMGTTGIWSGGLTWSRLLMVMVLLEIPVTLLLWLRLRQIAEIAGPPSLRRSVDVLAGVVPALIVLAGVLLIWREAYPVPPPRGWDNFDRSVALALMIYGAVALTAGVVATICVIRLAVALLPAALPGAMGGGRQLLLQARRMLRRATSLVHLPASRLSAVLTIGLLMVVGLAHFKVFDIAHAYPKRVGVAGNLPLMNYPGLKLNSVPLSPSINRSNFDYHRYRPGNGANWAFLGGAAIVVLMGVRRDVSPRLGRVLAWGTMIGIGGVAGVCIALGEIQAKAVLNSGPRQAGLLIPLVELPLTFLLHLWLADLAAAHGRYRAATTLRRLAYVVVLLQTLAVASLLLPHIVDLPMRLPDYRNSFPALAACGVYGTIALGTAIVSTTAVISLLAGLVRTALPPAVGDPGASLQPQPGPAVA